KHRECGEGRGRQAHHRRGRAQGAAHASDPQRTELRRAARPEVLRGSAVPGRGVEREHREHREGAVPDRRREGAGAEGHEVVIAQADAAHAGPRSAAADTSLLELNNVEVLYSDVILAVKGISARVPRGACVALLGANGGGKSTMLKVISHLIVSERSEEHTSELQS